MKLLVALPSKNRPDVLRSNALSWVDDLGFDYKIFIEPQDVEKYRLPKENIVILPENNRGYGFAKVCIKKYAQENGYDYIFKVDDDIKSWTDFRKVLNPVETALQIKKVVALIEKKFERYESLAGVSFPYSFQMFEHFSFKKAKGVRTAYIFRTEEFYADERVSNFDDFAMSISAIVHNKFILTCGLTGMVMGVKVGGGKGGQQDFDRLEQSKKEVGVLREIYPPLQFRRVEKRWGIEPDLKSIKIGGYL